MSHWVLQSGLEHEPGWATMLDTLERFGIPHSVHKVVPFVGELIPEPALATDDVLCIGSYSMRHAARRNQWNPGVFDLEPFGFDVQMQHWGQRMLNADSAIVAFKDARLDGARFVRPIDDTKVFAGRVFEADEFSAWQAKVVALEDGDPASLNADTLVQVSQPKDIYSETRCWIVDGRVVTASVYRVGSTVTYTDQVEQRFRDFAADLVSPSGWNPEKAFCLDICDTPDGLRVVEINTINSAGFYAADVEKLVMALDGLRR